MSRAKRTLVVVGVCWAGIGVMALPSPGTNPKAITQSLFENRATVGAFTWPALVLLCVGLGCLAVGALLPSNRR